MAEVHEVRDVVRAMIDEGVLERMKAHEPAHGTSALLTAPGTRPGMPSAMNRATALQLPMFKSRFVNDKVEIFTGRTAASGTTPQSWSGTPGVAGNLKVAQVSRPLGSIYLSSTAIGAPDVGERLDYADIDRFAMNGFERTSPFIPDVLNAQAVNTEDGKALWQLGLAIEEAVNRIDIIGDSSTAVASTELEVINEWDGLDQIVATGYADAVSSTDTDALDSYVQTIGADLSGSHVATIANAYRTVKMRAQLVGKPNVQFAIVTNLRGIYPLIDIWACNYATARCTAASQTVGRLDLGMVYNLRNEMLNGQYLLIDGEKVPLIGIDGVPATFNASPGDWTMDAFIIPLYDMAGGQGQAQRNGVEFMTYHHYKEMQITDLPGAANVVGDDFRLINNGLYMVRNVLAGMTRQYYIAAKLRLNCDYPFLCARVDNFDVTIGTAFGSSVPGDSDYLGGGVETR